VTASYTIVRAAPGHVAALPAIELQAAARFRGWNVPEAIMRVATPAAVLRDAQAAGRLWVALDQAGVPVGFALAASSRHRAFLEEVDVLPQCGRRRVGAALVQAVAQWAAASGHRELTLTTFRDMPWNLPFYETLGFAAIDPGDVDEELTQRLAAETARGLDPARRVAMCLPLGGAESVEEMWAAYLAACPGPEAAAAAAASYSAWHFCDDQAAADGLAELVVSGRKRATAGSLWTYELENEPLPQVGDLSVITDWKGRARCIICTTAVEVVPCDAVTAEFAATEGEGDGSLEYWRRAHWEFFTRELEGTGREPRPDMPVVCERFEVVFGPAR